MSDLGATISGALSGAGALGPLSTNPAFGIAGAVLGGLSGLFGASGARKKKRRMRRQLSNQQARLRQQIPGVQEYFKELESHKRGQSQKRKGQAIEQFVQSTVGTIPTLQRKIASTGLEGSGSAQKLVGSTKAKLQSGIDTSLGNLNMQEDDMLLSLDQQRKQQLQSIYDQIDTLQMKSSSL
tara:strand:- start:689 stop:1234 length:546 start_codon:yes stop_codon:yes gene_type:complete